MSISAGYVIVDMIDLPHRWDGALNFKPFSCRHCLSGWLSVMLWAFYGYPLICIPFLMCLVIMVSVFVGNALFKYL